jgi:hypothetical protein
MAKKRNEKYDFQVCAHLSDQKVIEREYRSLEIVSDSFPKYVVSLDKGFETTSSDMKWMNILAVKRTKTMKKTIGKVMLPRKLKHDLEILSLIAAN